MKEKFNLENKVAIITGAGQGLGEGIANAFAELGARVVLVGRTISKIERVVVNLRAAGYESLGLRADISFKDDIEKMVDRTLREFKKIDILVNNASIPSSYSLLDTTEEEWDRVLNVNLKGTFLCSQTVGREMAKNGQGKIINIASTAGVVAFTKKLAYSASKAGMIHLTKVMAAELAQFNIQVNGVAPGFFSSPMNIDRISSNRKLYEGTMRRIPLRREGKIEEIAAAVVFLACDASNYITGDTILVDGGWAIFGNVIM